MASDSPTSLTGLAGRPATGHLAFFVLALVLYAATAAPGVLWQDSGLFAYRVWHGDLTGNLGLALAHPLYIVSGLAVRALPWGDLARKLNLLSACFAAVAVANLFLLVRLWLGRTLPAAVAAITLTLSWTFWQHAVIAEVYSLLAALLLGELLLLLAYVRSRHARWLYLLGLVNGLAVSNHLLALFGTACYGGWVLAQVVRRDLSRRKALGFAAAFLAGAALYGALVARAALGPDGWRQALKSALFGQRWEAYVFNVEVTRRILLEDLVFLALNLPTPNALLLVPGAVAAWTWPRDRAFVRIVFILTAAYFVFAFRYPVADRFAFFLPFYCLQAVFVGAGAHWLLERRPARRWAALIVAGALLPAGISQITPSVARHGYPGLGEHRPRPYRDEYAYYLNPVKAGEVSAIRAGREVLAALPRGAVFYAFPTDVHVFLYAQEVEGRRPDVRIVSGTARSAGAEPLRPETFDHLVATEPVYFFTATPGFVPWFVREREDRYTFTPEGLAFRVGLAGGGASP